MTETELGRQNIGWREGLISLALLSNLKNAEGFVEKYTYCLINDVSLKAIQIRG